MLKFKIFIRNLIRKSFNQISNIDWNDKVISKNQVNYILAINDIFNEVSEIPGHIVELGTGKGRNAIIFGSLIHKYQQEKFKKYFGFDTFESFTKDDLKISPHLIKTASQELDFQSVQEFIASNNLNKTVTLIKGDIVDKIPEFIENKNNLYGFNKLLISLVYIDCNAYRPAIFSLEKLKKYFSENTKIVVDENTLGDETKALIDFCDQNKLKIKTTKFLNHISSYTNWK